MGLGICACKQRLSASKSTFTAKVTRNYANVFSWQPMRLLGLPLKVGDRARNVWVIGATCSPVAATLARSQGRSTFRHPSLDGPVCNRDFSLLV